MQRIKNWQLRHIARAWPIYFIKLKFGVKILRKCLILALVLLVLPALLYLYNDKFADKILDIPPQINQNVHKTVILADGDGTLHQLALEDATLGYLAAEMPATAPADALRAQAVAVRSFAWAEQLAAGQVCADSGHCMAYLSAEERAAKWGAVAAEYEELLEQAVADTAGVMLAVDGQAVKAYFSAACGGRTETAENLWGGTGYWPAVDCPWEGEAAVPGSVYYTRDELAGLLGVPADDVPLLCLAQEFDGRVCRVTLGRKSWRGAEFRALLGLKSTRFNWLGAADGVLFTSVGYGHGVGLCQAGAQGMARAGYSWRQILAHYYPGVDITKT